VGQLGTSLKYAYPEYSPYSNTADEKSSEAQNK